MTIYEELGAWLARLPQVTNVQTGSVTIGRTTYPAARYTKRLQHQPGTRAYQEGKREYTREMIYCVGDIPACKRHGNVAFTVADDSREWYVAAYYLAYRGRGKQAQAERNEYHPFGNSFMLAPWDVPDSTIDQYERVPYRRVAALLGRHWTIRAWEREAV